MPIEGLSEIPITLRLEPMDVQVEGRLKKVCVLRLDVDVDVLRGLADALLMPHPDAEDAPEKNEAEEVSAHFTPEEKREAFPTGEVKPEAPAPSTGEAEPPPTKRIRGKAKPKEEPAKPPAAETAIDEMETVAEIEALCVGIDPYFYERVLKDRVQTEFGAVDIGQLNKEQLEQVKLWLTSEAKRETVSLFVVDLRRDFQLRDNDAIKAAMLRIVGHDKMPFTHLELHKAKSTLMQEKGFLKVPTDVELDYRGRPITPEGEEEKNPLADFED